MTTIEILEDDRFTVPAVPPGSVGVGWLRASVVRFSEGEDRVRRRALVEELLGNISPSTLRQPGDHVVPTAAAICVLADGATQ